MRATLHSGWLRSCAARKPGRVLADIPLDKSRMPYQAVRAVAGAREFLAHAKTEVFDEIIPASRMDEMTPIEPEIMRFGSEAFATEALSQIEALANTLNAGLRAKFDYVPVGSAAGAFYGISGSSEASFPELQ